MRIRVDQSVVRKPQTSRRIVASPQTRPVGGRTEGDHTFSRLKALRGLDIAGSASFEDSITITGGIKMTGSIEADGFVSATQYYGLPIDLGYEFDFGTISSPSSFDLDLGTY